MSNSAALIHIPSDRKDILSSIDRCIEHHLDLIPPTPPLNEGVRYSLMPGGKRIRPLLTLSLVHDLGGEGIAILDAAAALEIMHTASLIHDDLPALDNDDLRRGRPTVHKVFGEATAILIGDFMISWALSVAMACPAAEQRGTAICSCLSDAFAKVCLGQQLDLQMDTQSHLERIHELKTGTLFGAAAELAALAITDDSALRARCRNFGLLIGRAFQSVDDFIDRFGTTEQRGRPESSDARNKKPTVFQSIGYEKALESMRDLRAVLSQALHDLERDVGCKLERASVVVDSIFAGRVPLV